uniref:Sulfite oxidase n=1 Tax=Davidia involucrata TaxID=16924 RepID=A0A5B7BB09_DAVIN
MAASVENRQFSRLEPGLSGVVRAFKSGTNHRSESPVRVCNFPPTPGLTHPKKPVVVEDSSSDDDDDDENDYNDSIRKAYSELEPSVLDSRDEGTADNWIERNPSMIRLTGKHPFNSEPPLPRLMHHGFITPVPLHYVRNHGPVPKATWEDWTVEVCGLVKRPARFTMDQLVNDFPSREIPVTLVCAGNRRKEQNMVKQTIGFNWGAAGISNSVWRGVPLRYVLKKCGIFSIRNGAVNVCFEGAEDLPGGGGSKYGTSIRKEIAMDASRDIILAYMQNGERLSPDHGFPVRMIIPGFIGGRMVKWLKRIIVTTQESDSYYHYRDNRVLPSLVDAELANVEAWWYKPDYIINELNINSVITTPCHEEILPINSWTTQRPYTLNGYAYSVFCTYGSVNETESRTCVCVCVCVRCDVRRRWEESDTCGGDNGWWGDVARVQGGVSSEAQQVRQILVLVLLVTGGGGAGPTRIQRDGGSSLGRDPQHATREANLEPHGYDEQLLVPSEDECVQTTQRRDRNRFRAPDSARQPVRRMDGS